MSKRRSFEKSPDSSGPGGNARESVARSAPVRPVASHSHVAEEHSASHAALFRWLLIAAFAIIEIALVAMLYNSWLYNGAVNAAKKAMAAQEWNEALKHWERHAKNYPGARDAVPYRIDLAQCRLGAQQFEGALEDARFVLKQIQKTDLRYPALLAIKGQCEAELGLTAEAKATFEELLKADPSNTPANLFLSRRLLAEGKLLAAARYIQAVPEKDIPPDLSAEILARMKEAVAEAERNAGSAQTEGAAREARVGNNDIPGTSSLQPTQGRPLSPPPFVSSGGIPSVDGNSTRTLPSPDSTPQPGADSAPSP